MERDALHQQQKIRKSTFTAMADCVGDEMLSFGDNEVRKIVRARWGRVRAALISMARMRILLRNITEGKKAPKEPGEEG